MDRLGVVDGGNPTLYMLFQQSLDRS